MLEEQQVMEREEARQVLEQVEALVSALKDSLIILSTSLQDLELEIRALVGCSAALVQGLSIHIDPICTPEADGTS